MFRPSRNRRRDDDALVLWKVRIFAVGAVLALGGMALEQSWFSWAGLGVLAGGFAIVSVIGWRRRRN